MQENKRYAAIDIGSNAIRLLVAEESQNQFKVLEELRCPVRLGHRVFTEGSLDPETFQEAIETLQMFRDRMDAWSVHVYRAVATSAIRDSDPNKFEEAMVAIGLDVEVIDGHEEARLVHRALRDRLPLGDEPWLLVDLGGGSLELVLADRNHIYWSESKPIGTVRLLETLHDQTAMHNQVNAYRMMQTQWNVEGIAITGGNATSIAELLGVATKEAASIGFRELRGLRRDLESYSVEGRMKTYGLDANRADVIAQAAHVYEWVAAKSGQGRIHVPGWGLREGVLFDLMDRESMQETPLMMVRGA